jgi:hypothetical protein
MFSVVFPWTIRGKKYHVVRRMQSVELETLEFSSSKNLGDSLKFPVLMISSVTGGRWK